MYLNGMIAVFQFFFSLLLCVPSSLASDPPVPIPQLPRNLLNGLKCYVGISSVTCEDDEDDGECSEDVCNPNAPLFVTIYLVFNQLYNLLIILILKYGSANILWLAMTLMVPLGNVVSRSQSVNYSIDRLTIEPLPQAFTLPFVPEHQGLRSTDIIGLVVICAGLGVYRFLADYMKSREEARERVNSASAKEPLLNLVNDVDRVISVTGEDQEHDA